VANRWGDAKLEQAGCFRCRVPGKELYRREPFALVRCPECGQAFISPRLAEQGRERVYDSDYFDEGVYGYKKRFSLSLWHQRTWSGGRLDMIERLVAEPRGRRLLEIGCAYGFFLNLAAERGFAVSGIEYSGPAVAWARTNTKLDIRQGTVETVSLPAASFDVVCFWDVFEHVPDPGFFLSVVAKTLKPGGLVALSCPNFGSLPAKLFRSHWATLRPEQHIWHFDRQTLARALTEAGFEDVGIVASLFARSNLTRIDSLVAFARLASQRHQTE
jgi:SAM-dependent methyltransferase